LADGLRFTILPLRITHSGVPVSWASRLARRAALARIIHRQGREEREERKSVELIGTFWPDANRGNMT
jgi:hypothetical protein